MIKILSRILNNAIKEKKFVLGSKEVLTSIKNSKLIITSKSIHYKMIDEIQKNAKQNKIPVINIDDSSIILGKMCGFPFRVSAMSLTSINDQDIKSLLQQQNKKS